MAAQGLPLAWQLKDRLRGTLVSVLLSLVPVACSSQEPQAGLDSYWSQFRQAVLDGDEQRIASMTRFPFEVHGLVDGEPSQNLDRGEFLACFERLMDQLVYMPVSGQLVPLSMSAVIRDTVTPPEPNPAGTVRCQQFEFERVAGAWWFTRAFLEE